MTVGELLAQAEIRQVMAAYNQAGDRMRLDELAAQFTADGVLKYPGVVARGRAEIADALARGGRELAEAAGLGERPALTKVRHHLTTSTITVEDETAVGRSYFLVVSNLGSDHAGVYVDRFRKVADRWLIAEREVRIDWQSATSGWGPLVG